MGVDFWLSSSTRKFIQHSTFLPASSRYLYALTTKVLLFANVNKGVYSYALRWAGAAPLPSPAQQSL